MVGRRAKDEQHRGDQHWQHGGEQVAAIAGTAGAKTVLGLTGPETRGGRTDQHQPGPGGYCAELADFTMRYFGDLTSVEVLLEAVGPSGDAVCGRWVGCRRRRQPSTHYPGVGVGVENMVPRIPTSEIIIQVSPSKGKTTKTVGCNREAEL